MLPAPPPGGGTLYLSPAQFADPALRAAIATVYPDTKVVENQPLPLNPLGENGPR